MNEWIYEWINEREIHSLQPCDQMQVERKESKEHQHIIVDKNGLTWEVEVWSL